MNHCTLEFQLGKSYYCLPSFAFSFSFFFQFKIFIIFSLLHSYSPLNLIISLYDVDSPYPESLTNRIFSKGQKWCLCDELKLIFSLLRSRSTVRLENLHSSMLLNINWSGRAHFYEFKLSILNNQLH